MFGFFRPRALTWTEGVYLVGAAGLAINMTLQYYQTGEVSFNGGYQLFDNSLVDISAKLLVGFGIGIGATIADAVNQNQAQRVETAASKTV